MELSTVSLKTAGCSHRRPYHGRMGLGPPRQASEIRSQRHIAIVRTVFSPTQAIGSAEITLAERSNSVQCKIADGCDPPVFRLTLIGKDDDFIRSWVKQDHVFTTVRINVSQL